MRRCAHVLVMLRAAAIVPRTRWQPQAERHLARVTKLLSRRLALAAQSCDDPLLNFVLPITVAIWARPRTSGDGARPSSWGISGRPR